VLVVPKEDAFVLPAYLWGCMSYEQILVKVFRGMGCALCCLLKKSIIVIIII